MGFKERNIELQPKISEFESILKCLVKKMFKNSWMKTLENDTFENRLLSIMLAVNAGNISKMSEIDMKRFILKPGYNCENELPHCFHSCNLLLSKLTPLLTNTAKF